MVLPPLATSPFPAVLPWLGLLQIAVAQFFYVSINDTGMAHKGLKVRSRKHWYRVQMEYHGLRNAVNL